ncbi:hypothetical protein FKP32DRAFT_457711 [Trametes sanguinea]|nr:hypothetical protein FKP32DRAFT_457711 [Trametes sanguinea]
MSLRTDGGLGSKRSLYRLNLTACVRCRGPRICHGRPSAAAVAAYERQLPPPWDVRLQPVHSIGSEWLNAPPVLHLTFRTSLLERLVEQVQAPDIGTDSLVMRGAGAARVREGGHLHTLTSFSALIAGHAASGCTRRVAASPDCSPFGADAQVLELSSRSLSSSFHLPTACLHSMSSLGFVENF